MDANLQITLPIAFSWMKIYEFRLAYDYTDIYSQVSHKKYSSSCLDNGLAPTRRQAIIWNNDGLFTDGYMRHSASLS